MALPSLEESLSGNNGGAGKVQIEMEPGTQFSYSGGGYTLLQLVIEKVTGETFSDYMQREVLDPLGMSNSSFEWRADLRPATAVAYSASGSSLPNYLFTEQAAAGLYTTAPDLALFVAAEMPGPDGEPAGRGVLKPDTLTHMFKPVIKIQTGVAQGLGQSVSTLPDGSRVIQHSGKNEGWQANMLANPQWGVGVVILTNSDNGEGLNRDVVFREVLPLLIIERVLLMLIFVHDPAPVLLVYWIMDIFRVYFIGARSTIFIVRRWIKGRSLVGQAK